MTRDVVVKALRRAGQKLGTGYQKTGAWLDRMPDKRRRFVVLAAGLALVFFLALLSGCETTAGMPNAGTEPVVTGERHAPVVHHS